MTGFLPPGPGASPSGQFLAPFFGPARGPAADSRGGRHLRWAATALPAVGQALPFAGVDPAKRDHAANEESEAARILGEGGRALDSLRQDDTPVLDGRIDPVTSRDGESEQTVDVLPRHAENSPVLTGESGTAVRVDAELRFDTSSAA